MSARLEIKQSIVTPTGTQACFIKESPDKLKAFFERDMSAEAELRFLESELPSTVQFGLIRDPRLQVLRGIPVAIGREGNVYVVSWEQAEEFGYGANRSEALEDFGRTIAQLFITLDREKDTLGPSLIETLNLLRNHLQFRG